MALSMSRAVFEEKAKKAEETRQAVRTALMNEQITRKRVELIEAVVNRNLLGRLKWLLKGE